MPVGIPNFENGNPSIGFDEDDLVEEGGDIEEEEPVVAFVAAAFATRMSQAKARQQPAPMAGPWIEAMVGTGS